MSEPSGETQFAPEDFAYVAKWLRGQRTSEVTFGMSIFLKRLDLNIILAALDAMSEDRG